MRSTLLCLLNKGFKEQFSCYLQVHCVVIHGRYLMNARVETLVRNIPSASTLLVDTDALVSQVSSYIAENAEVSLNLELSL